MEYKPDLHMEIESSRDSPSVPWHIPVGNVTSEDPTARALTPSELRFDAPLSIDFDAMTNAVGTDVGSARPADAVISATTTTSYSAMAYSAPTPVPSMVEFKPTCAENPTVMETANADAKPTDTDSNNTTITNTTQEPSTTGGKKSKTIYARKQDLNMLCEWNQCNQTFKDVEKFNNHVRDHIGQELGEYKTLPNACKWTACDYERLDGIDGANTMIRHIYFHCFHSKLKSLGETYTRHYDYPQCLLDPQTRNMIPELPDNLICGWTHCGALHDSVEFFYMHVYNHTLNEGDLKCYWNDCGSQFPSKSKLREHIRSHTQEKVVSCPGCGALYASRTRFADHVNRQLAPDDANATDFVCSHCNRNFASERILRDHMRHHVNCYKCTMCDMTCPSPSALRSHIKYRHSVAAMYPCELCEYSAKRPVDLRRHMETHVPQDFFSCHMEDCTYKCKTYQSLSNHYKRFHDSGEVYECHLCNKQLSRGSELTQHLRKLHHFKWPSGHRRFRYKLHQDGIWRLQMVRYESVELSLIPEEKIIQSLQKDGVNPQQIQKAPPRQCWAVPKPRKPRKSRAKPKPPGEEPKAKCPKKSKKKKDNVQNIDDNAAHAVSSTDADLDTFVTSSNTGPCENSGNMEDTDSTRPESLASESTRPESIVSTRDNLTMLGDVALGFKGLFPKRTEESPVIWQDWIAATPGTSGVSSPACSSPTKSMTLSPARSIDSSNAVRSSSRKSTSQYSSPSKSPWKSPWSETSTFSTQTGVSKLESAATTPSYVSDSNPYANSNPAFFTIEASPWKDTATPSPSTSEPAPDTSVIAASSDDADNTDQSRRSRGPVNPSFNPSKTTTRPAQVGKDTSYAAATESPEKSKTPRKMSKPRKLVRTKSDVDSTKRFLDEMF